ncbi:MAG: protein kinase [Hyphomicrobiales bacterium]|nr:protein kinase [Hyphomicrobiales bacterium]
MSSDEPEVGDTIRGRFVLEEKLGEGGMGRIFKALDLLRQEARDREPYVAIKFVSDAFRRQPISFIALQREAKKAQMLTHPNIVRVYDFDRDGPLIYLVMEYLSGTALSRTIRSPANNGVPMRDALKIIEPVASALAFAHKNGIVHLDIKPSNIILTRDGNVKVIDFGIARAFRRPNQADADTVFDPGLLGALTAVYASPDTIDGLEPDPRDDVFSLAIVTYELLTGRHPFNRDPSTKARAQRRAPAHLAKLGRRQWAALRRGLSFDREQRTHSVEEFVAGLRGDGASMVRWSMVAGATLFAAVFLGGVSYLVLAPEREQIDATGIVSVQERAKGSDRAPSQVSGLADNQEMARLKPADQPAPQPEVVDPSAVFGVVEQAPCSVLSSVIDEGSVQVAGYAGDASNLDFLRSSLNRLPGIRSVFLDNVQRVPSLHCDSLDLYRQFVVNNRALNLGVAINPAQHSSRFRAGDELIVVVSGPNYPSHIYVDYLSLDGHVIHMLPNSVTQSNQVSPHQQMTLGAGSIGSWIIGEPFGTEMIVVLGSPRPLFSGVREEVEPTDRYLVDLRHAIERVARQQTVDHIGAEVLFITTGGRR